MKNTNPLLNLTPNMIAFEDDYLLIIDKPPGMLVHPLVNEKDFTLYNYVLAYYKGKKFNSQIHPISRLDRNTSGLVMFAKEPIVQFWLSQEHIKKEYLAIVYGKVNASAGIIEAPIARKENSIIERCIDFSRGKYAKTAFRVLGYYGNKTLLSVHLFTGRTHQIRVHLAYIGHPIVNDHLYGTKGPQARHALHSWKLAFKHPVGDFNLEITRYVPEDFVKILHT